ncbi:MAG TPA: RHS repeat-associated core domain-containing protein [Puia sp.]
MVSRLNGNVNISGNNQVGPGIVLKVMTGDTISISTFSWYSGAVQPAATGVPAISTELISLLTAGVAGENGGKGGTIPTTYSSPFLVTDISTLVSDDSSTYVTTRPKAFLNWMVVGEDYTAATNSPNHVGAIQIPVCNAGDSLKQIVGPTNMVVRRNGWIYVYLSNQSNQDVFFDNLVVNLKHGPLVEQKDYYPFGMENPALSTKTIKANYYENRIKFNGKELQNKEFTDGTGIEEYDYESRMQDPQLGIWHNIDQLADKSAGWSPYSYTFNNPMRFIDPDGRMPQLGHVENDAEQQMDVQLQQENQSLFQNLMKIYNSLKQGESLSINLENQHNNESGNEWISYTGQNVTVYGGSDGDKSNVLYTFRGSSGLNDGYKDSRNSKYQKDKDKGPVPNGKYRINLIPDPNRIANNNADGSLTPSHDGGIEQIPERIYNSSRSAYWEYPGWGTWRARLNPLPGTNLYGRDGLFYLHNSTKGFSHGCIECSPGIYNVLINYRNAGKKYIDVIVDYPNNNTSTYGHTDR